MSLPDDHDARGAARATAGHEQRAETGGCRRILVVDDHRALVAITATVLQEEFGFDVAVAYSGVEGVRLAEEFRPHVVLCDISLAQGVSGYDVARAIRATSEGAKMLLIAVTAFAAEDIEAASAEAGFDLALSKPVDFEALHRLIKERLG